MYVHYFIIASHLSFPALEFQPKYDSIQLAVLITYSCEHCDHKAKRKSDLLPHVQSVHEQITYSCEHCDYKARWKRDLVRHVQSIHEGITYSCDHKAKQKICLRQYVQSMH